MDHAPEFERAQRAARRLRFTAVIAVAGILSAIGGYALHEVVNPAIVPTDPVVHPKSNAWSAASAGRVEAKSGEVAVGSALPGRVSRALVGANEKVEAGEPLILLDDEEARARLSAVLAEAATRQRDRDAQPAIAGRVDVRKSEDDVYAASRALASARLDLDGLLEARRRGVASASESALAEARTRMQEVGNRLRQAKLALAAAAAKPNLPAPNRLDAALSAARANVAAAQSFFDKTRLRTPIAGSVLKISVTPGETIAPAPDSPLAVIGDPSQVVVKADIDQRDIAKVKIGQEAYVRSDAFPGQQFEGKVTSLAPALAPRALPGQVLGRPSEMATREATVALDGAVPLRPGQRVDVFYRSEP